MSLVKTPADDSKTAAAEDHEVAAATKSGRPTAKDAALLAFVSSIGPFAANAYVPAFDEIGRYYGVGLVTVQQTLSIYLAAFACTSLLIGAASDAFGRKAVLALSMMVFAVSSLGLLFADSMEAFFIWRFVMGMAAAAGPVVTQAIVRDRWSGGDAAKIIALIAVIFGLAPALAPVVGGELTVHLGWRSIFIFLAVLSAAMAFCSACVLKESLPSARRVSFRPWATLLRYGEVLKVPAFTSGVVAHGFIFLGLIVYSAGAADFVLNVMGLGVDEFGWLMIPMVVAGMTGSWACAHLLAMFGQNRLLFGGVGILAASGLFGVVFDHGPFAVFPWVLLAPVVCSGRSPGTQRDEPRLFPQKPRLGRFSAAVFSDGRFCGFIEIFDKGWAFFIGAPHSHRFGGGLEVCCSDARFRTDCSGAAARCAADETCCPGSG